jgi:hypothetical protein
MNRIGLNFFKPFDFSKRFIPNAELSGARRRPRQKSHVFARAWLWIFRQRNSRITGNG